MSRMLQKIIEFLNPKPSPEFHQRMADARRDARKESLDAISATKALRHIDVESMYDRLVVDRPDHKKKGGV